MSDACTQDSEVASESTAYMSASSQMKSGNWAAAVGILQDALQKEPDDCTLHLLLVRLP